MNQKQLPSYTEFLFQIQKNIQDRMDVSFHVCNTLRYQTADGVKEYDFVNIVSKPINLKDKILLIRAGIHGDEIAGPLTLMKHIGEIFTYAHKHEVKLSIYPLDNPSGFEAHTRYNIEQDCGDGGNNDFVRYQKKDGTFFDDLRGENTFEKWFWSSDPNLLAHLPKETKLLHVELKKLPLKQIRGVIDFHQDNFIIIPAAYHYAFGDITVYTPIIEKLKQKIKILSNEFIDSKYLNDPNYTPEVVQGGKIVTDDFNPKSDANGFIIQHDGTLPDLFYRLGSRYCVTVETTKITPEPLADEINLLWIYGIIDLVAKG